MKKHRQQCIKPRKVRRSLQWCDRHWDPYRTRNEEGEYPNGIYASVRLMEEFINSSAVLELSDVSPVALNRFMEESEVPVCCRLGDEVMGRILQEAWELRAEVDMDPRQPPTAEVKG